MDDHRYTKNTLSIKGKSVTQVMKWETATTVRHFPDDQQSRLHHCSLPAKHSPSTHWVNIAFVLIKSVQFLRSVTFCNSGHVIFAQQTSRTDITQMILPAISSNHYSPPANHHCSHHFVIHLQIGTFFFSNTDIVISELLIANRTDVNTYVWLCTTMAAYFQDNSLSPFASIFNVQNQIKSVPKHLLWQLYPRIWGRQHKWFNICFVLQKTSRSMDGGNQKLPK